MCKNLVKKLEPLFFKGYRSEVLKLPDGCIVIDSQVFKTSKVVKFWTIELPLRCEIGV